MIFSYHLLLEIVLAITLISAMIWLLLIRRHLLKQNSDLDKEIQRRTQAEKELFKNERNHSKLVHSIGEGIGIVDGNEIFNFANKAAEMIFETEEGKLTGRSVTEFLNEQEIEKIKTGTDNRKKGLTDRYELNIVTEKGNTKVIEITVSPNIDENGNYESSFGVFRDITDYKSALIKLRENEEMFRTLLNNAPLPIFYKSINGKYLGCNEEFEKFIGMKESEIVGKTVYDLAPAELADRYKEKDMELFKKGGTQVYEWKAKKNDGSVRNIIYHKAALYDYLGNITGLIGAIVDVTELKKYEEMLELKQAELERSNKDLEQFAYTVSHDLQEPLRMVSGFTNLLKKKYSTQLNSEALSYIDFSVDGAKRMQEQIQGILSYSRISTQAGEFENISLNEIIEHSLKNLSVAIKESGAEIKYGQLPCVNGDRSQFISVFQNLIGNSLKFRKEGFVPEIMIESKEIQDLNKIEISVSDNGIGIESKHLENIFLIFHRLHSQDKYPGTGIGLSVVKKIIERHGGTITAESERGKGTKFRMLLNREIK